MLLTVTPNACIERTLQVEEFRVGGSFRVAAEHARADACGKGVNAARVAANLGAQVLATGWIGHFEAAWFRAQLDAQGVAHDLVEVDSPTRVGWKVLDGSDASNAQTEVIEAGTPLPLSDGTRLLQTVESHISRAKLCAVCGSYPPSAPQDRKAFEAHVTLLKLIAQKHGVPIILDGRGPAFEMALRHKSALWAIKPNLDEARQLLRRPIESEAEERAAVREFGRLGVEVVLLSCGARGLYVGTSGGVWLLTAPQVSVVSEVGSGDALVGAFAARWLDTEHFLPQERVLEAARWGVAAGAANAAQAFSGFCTRQDVEELLPQVRVRPQVISLLA